MKKALLLVCLSAFVAGLAGAAEVSKFTMPTDEQIKAIAEDPSKLRDFLEDANEDEAVDLLLKVIEAVDGLGLSDAAAQQRVGQLLAETAKIKGASAPPIIARVLKRVQPRLLPVIHWGGMGGSLPPGSPGYNRQR
ncbi:hypothetical protein ACFLQU_01495 [Verrucomicrobiota bacterium]